MSAYSPEAGRHNPQTVLQKLIFQPHMRDGIDFEHLIDDSHPQIDLYRTILNDHNNRHIPTVPFLTVATLFARPTLWATKDEIYQTVGSNAGSMVGTNVNRVRKYLRTFSPPLTIWNVRQSLFKLPDSDYFRQRADWDDGKYIIADESEPPEFIDCQIPNTGIQDPELLELYIRALTQLAPPSANAKKHKNLTHVFTCDERVILDYLITHDNMATTTSIGQYYDRRIGMYKDVSTVISVMYTLRQKIGDFSSVYYLVEANKNHGVYELKQVDG